MAKFKERRSAPKAARVSAELLAPPTGPAAAGESRALRDAAGFYTLDALRAFIQYDLDGSVQTEWNERFIMPLCLAVIDIDGLADLPNAGARNRCQAVVGETLKRVTRRADRLGRADGTFLVLLRRTLAKRARDAYFPHVRKALADGTDPAGKTVTLSGGIVSLTEHMVTGADDMIAKGRAALAAARASGPGTATIYDFRTMPSQGTD